VVHHIDDLISGVGRGRGSGDINAGKKSFGTKTNAFGIVLGGKAKVPRLLVKL
jgi:hypothetical protein